VAIGAVTLSALSDLQERLMVMDNQTKGISTSHHSLFAVIVKLKKVLPSQHQSTGGMDATKFWIGHMHSFQSLGVEYLCY